MMLKINPGFDYHKDDWIPISLAKPVKQLKEYKVTILGKLEDESIVIIENPDILIDQLYQKEEKFLKVKFWMYIK